jgi:hypothetical protein
LRSGQARRRPTSIWRSATATGLRWHRGCRFAPCPHRQLCSHRTLASCVTRRASRFSSVSVNCFRRASPLEARRAVRDRLAVVIYAWLGLEGEPWFGGTLSFRDPRSGFDSGSVHPASNAAAQPRGRCSVLQCFALHDLCLFDVIDFDQGSLSGTHGEAFRHRAILFRLFWALDLCLLFPVYQPEREITMPRYSLHTTSTCRAIWSVSTKGGASPIDLRPARGPCAALVCIRGDALVLARHRSTESTSASPRTGAVCAGRASSSSPTPGTEAHAARGRTIRCSTLGWGDRRT